MLDDLRNSTYYDDNDDLQEPDQDAVEAVMKPAGFRGENFLGLTAQQRFFLSLMLFAMVCILGMFALVATGSVSLPF